MPKSRYLRTSGFVFGIVVVMGIFLIVAAPARAELVGCRDSSAGGGVSGFGLWAGGTPPNFQICWDVSFDGTNWIYEYTFTTVTRDVSHVIIELSPGLTDLDVTGGTLVEGPDNFGPSPSNPGMPESMYGIKVNDGASNVFSFTITTPVGPEWGDFYAKDGGNPDTFAFNTGFTSPDSDPTTDPATTVEIDSIVRPDTRVPPPPPPGVPEPGAALLLAAGLMGIATLRKTKPHLFAA